MTLKDVIEKWTPQSWRRMAIAGTLAVSGVAGAQTTLVPVDSYSGSQAYSGVAVGQNNSGNPIVVVGFPTASATDVYDAQNISSGEVNDYSVAGFEKVLDQASTGADTEKVYHLVQGFGGDVEVVSTNNNEVTIPSVTPIGTFNNYDHLAAVQIGTDDYLILVEKDGTDPHYRIWDVDDPDGGWVGSAIDLPTQLDISIFPYSVDTDNTRGAGAYFASSGTSEDSNIESIIIGLNLGGAIAFFKNGSYLEDRYTVINGINGAAEDISFNPDYSTNLTEVYVSSNDFSGNGDVARLAISGTTNLPIYVNPVAIITGDTEGLEDEQPNPQISITLSRHPNDKSDTVSTVPPVPEVPTTVEYSIGGTATRGVGQDYTIDGE